ncbi:allatotropins-like [Metopolophium dirhodum]|uniref:allatotropins-like n=1 Tax=Metopolophium dirhodum TaxID=44670 RepID=UPI002990066A|nr:allatotropins-like [Metopolophium dirhodum]
MAVNNNIMVRLLVIEITFLILAVVNSYPAFEDSEFKHKNRDKGRTIRGFKNMDLSTARGFGKRTDHYMNLMPLDLFVDNKEDSFNQNIPMEVSLEKILKSKYKHFIEKLIDVNHDGYISGEELLQSIDGES